MPPLTMPCNPPTTTADKRWPYVEYYLGERDDENRKNGRGSHHWSGAESLEWYTGRMLRDTMHGYGDYRWRYLGAEHLATTYEGRFYNNSMHGYGIMSYPDGRVFNGLFHSNFRWGPGVETHACVREDVGLWYGSQLVRLAWRPSMPSVAIDLVSTTIGANTITPHRILLTTNVETIGQVNSALELLKQSGCDPLAAANKWPQLYAKNCTDLSSQLCQVEAFNRAYYKHGLSTLNEVEDTIEPDKDSSLSTVENATNKTIYYAWNNNKTIIHMMKHSFTHEFQRHKQRLNIENILSGSRRSFKRPGKHELDCRSLIMASYLGFISNVATLINECDVVPVVTDSQGNTAVMYAACGDQPDTIHFLMEAGGEVDTYNDACCTALGITILRYALEKRGVAYSAMLHALLPPSTALQLPPSPDKSILEWKISRQGQSQNIPAAEVIQKHTSKTKMNTVGLRSSKDLSLRKKTDVNAKIQESPKTDDNETVVTTDAFAGDKQLYDSINTQYKIRVAEAFSEPSEVSPIPYIFEVNDMCNDVELFSEEETKKVSDKPFKKTASKIKHPINKPSRDENFLEDAVEEVIDPRKQEKLARIMLTILQLLAEGADPRKVRCPQPPLLIAAAAGSADLIRQLVKHGADIHEVYPQAYGYTTLDVAVSGPLTTDNLEVIHALLQCGANPDHRLKLPEQPRPQASRPNMTIDLEGPTLLHAVLVRNIEPEAENFRLVEHRDQLLRLLLQYGCNPITQYRGHSAMDLAMNKGVDTFDIFIRNRRTDLNAVINESNQTILVKMFSLPFCSTILLSEKLQILTNLLLFGADPLIKCRNENDVFGNLFVFAKTVLTNMQAMVPAKGTTQGTKGQKKPQKKADLKQKKSVKSVPSKHKINEESPGDYKQALELVVDCARLLHIRWLQGTLMKELIDVVYKYKQRDWSMILKEHKNKKCTSLWLNVHRGLEIWDVLKTTRKRIYKSDKILKQVLCIIHFYFMRTKILRYYERHVITRSFQSPRITFQEKEFIENEVTSFIREHRLATLSGPDMVQSTRQYVAPELTVKELEKFKVCFECAMPLEINKIPCELCELITFCSFECMKTNIDRINCHPCSEYLREKYFPTPEEAETNTEESLL